MDILIKVIQLFLCFTLLVGIHELGHFLMARVFGIRVEKSSTSSSIRGSRSSSSSAAARSTAWAGCRWAVTSRSPA